jgi:hypothetical protein
MTERSGQRPRTEMFCYGFVTISTKPKYSPLSSITTNIAMMTNNNSRRGNDMNTSSNHSRRGRIPAALQAIFLASNGGQEVNEPPKNLGFKVFSRILGGKSKALVYDKNVLESSPENDEVSQRCP